MHAAVGALLPMVDLLLIKVLLSWPVTRLNSLFLQIEQCVLSSSLKTLALLRRYLQPSSSLDHPLVCSCRSEGLTSAYVTEPWQ